VYSSVSTFFTSIYVAYVPLLLPARLIGTENSTLSPIFKSLNNFALVLRLIFVTV